MNTKTEQESIVAAPGGRYTRVKGLFQKYQKPLALGISVIIVGILGWYGYQNYVIKPKEDEAAEAMFKAQQFFQQDSLNLALNGNVQSKGFLYIINNYGGTRQENLAHYYAGVSYLKLGDFNKAVEHLKDFKTDASQVQMMAYGSLGDAYSELGNSEEAVNYYKKAVSEFDVDQVLASEYLFRAGLLLEASGKTEEALKVYKDIKAKFPTTERGYQVDKYIYRISIEPNDFSSK